MGWLSACEYVRGLRGKLPAPSQLTGLPPAQHLLKPPFPSRSAAPRTDGRLAPPADLVDGTGDEALDVRPVSEDLREGVAEGGGSLDGGKADLP